MTTHTDFNLNLRTERLNLRPFELTDASRVFELASDVEIAKTTLHIPHPYPKDGATQWITRLSQALSEGRQYTFAVTDKSDGKVLGSMGIGVDATHARGELGYWIGHEYWGHGYGTEAARAVLAFGFGPLRLNRIYAFAMTTNPASWRIMEKVGMQYEGTMRQHIVKWGEYVDLALYGIVKSDYNTIQHDATHYDSARGRDEITK